VGIGIRLILTSEWERGGMGIDYMGMGGNVNIKIHSRSSLTYHYLLLTAYFLDCQLVFFICMFCCLFYLLPLLHPLLLTVLHVRLLRVFCR